MDKDFDITLFEPVGRDMKLDYPELSEYEDFKNLTAREIRLCWLVGNRTSPISSRSPEQRVRSAINQCYPSVSRDREEVKNMLNGKIPLHIKNGIKRMSSFRPSVRLRAKLMDEYAFDKLQNLIHIEESELLAMETEEKKKFAELVIKVTSELPKLVTRMESGYGIKAEREEAEASVKVGISNIRDRIQG